MKKKPSRFVRQFQRLRKVRSRTATFVICKQKHRPKPVSKLKMSFIHNSAACHRCLMTTAFALVCVTLLDVIILCAATFRANKALWETQFKKKLTALVFRIEFLLKIYDTELAFVCFSFRHNVFTSLFVVMPILYHTICPFDCTFDC